MLPFSLVFALFACSIVQEKDRPRFERRQGETRSKTVIKCKDVSGEYIFNAADFERSMSILPRIYIAFKSEHRTIASLAGQVVSGVRNSVFQ